MLKLFAPVLSSILGTEVEVAARRARRNAQFYAVIAGAVLTATFFLLIAVFFALAMKFGLIGSALIISAVCLILAVAAYIINRLLDNAEKRRLAERRAALDTNAALTAAAVAAVPVLLKKPLVTLAVPLAGLVAFGLLSQTRKADRSTKEQV